MLLNFLLFDLLKVAIARDSLYVDPDNNQCVYTKESHDEVDHWFTELLSEPVLPNWIGKKDEMIAYADQDAFVHDLNSTLARCLMHARSIADVTDVH